MLILVQFLIHCTKEPYFLLWFISSRKHSLQGSSWPYFTNFAQFTETLKNYDGKT